MEFVGSDSFISKVEKSKIPILVCFFSPECRPCALMTGDLDDLAEEYRDVIGFFRVNTSSEQELVNRMGIVSTPTLILYIGGTPVLRLLGYVTKHDIREKVESQLKISTK